MSQTKELKVRIPIALHQAFVRTFPGHGERSTFVRQMIAYAVGLADQKDCFVERIREAIEEDLGR